MPDTASRLVGPVAVAAATAAIGSAVPASTTWVVRNIHVTNTTAASINFTLGIGGTTAALSLYSTLPIPAGGTLDWSGFLVLATTEQFHGFGSATGLTITISGVART